MDQLQNSQITLCPDGKYRWAYEFNLYRNPTILFVLFKIFGAIIGANAVVTHDIPPYCVAAGIPAKVIKQL